MQFLRRWLKAETAPTVALHPSRTLEIQAPAARTFERCVEGIERVLGGNVARKDPHAGTIEATFGLVGSERLNVSVEAIDANASRVRIESRRGALAAPQRQEGSSSYVDALCAFLSE